VHLALSLQAAVQDPVDGRRERQPIAYGEAFQLRLLFIGNERHDAVAAL